MGGRGSGGIRNSADFSKQDFTKGGIYNIYRAGELNSDSPLAFFTPDKDSAYYYSLFANRAQGEFDEYQIAYSNPLIAEGETDRERVVDAWQKLHPDKELKPTGAISTAQLAKWWMRLDKQNAVAMKKQGYDAIVMRDSKTKEVEEVQLLTKTGKMSKRGHIRYNRKGN